MTGYIVSSSVWVQALRSILIHFSVRRYSYTTTNSLGSALASCWLAVVPHISEFLQFLSSHGNKMPIQSLFQTQGMLTWRCSCFACQVDVFRVIGRLYSIGMTTLCSKRSSLGWNIFSKSCLSRVILFCSDTVKEGKLQYRSSNLFSFSLFFDSLEGVSLFLEGLHSFLVILAFNLRLKFRKLCSKTKVLKLRFAGSMLCVVSSSSTMNVAAATRITILMSLLFCDTGYTHECGLILSVLLFNHKQQALRVLSLKLERQQLMMSWFWLPVQGIRRTQEWCEHCNPVKFRLCLSRIRRK